MNFKDLPLHDTVLVAIEMPWKDKVCRVIISSHQGMHVIEFRGVTSVLIPHKEEWGPSECINSAFQEGHFYKIEMQTGDQIEIEAREYEFSTL